MQAIPDPQRGRRHSCRPVLVFWVLVSVHPHLALLLQPLSQLSQKGARWDWTAEVEAFLTARRWIQPFPLGGTVTPSGFGWHLWEQYGGRSAPLGFGPSDEGNWEPILSC